MRVIMDFKRKRNIYYVVEVDNISFGIDEISFVFDAPGGIVYIFDIPDDGTEAYNILSNEVFEKGTLDLRGYSYQMYRSDTLEEIFDDEEESEE